MDSLCYPFFIYILFLDMIADKDWNRMYDLIVDGKNGESVAKSITNKTKAISRYVAAMRLLNIDPNKRFNKGLFTGEFEAFGNKALELGATFQDILDEWQNTPKPFTWIEKIKEEIGATEYRGKFNVNFWKKLRHSGIPVSTKEYNSDYGDINIKIIFYPNTYDQCSISVAYNSSQDAYAIEKVEDLNIEHTYIGSRSFLFEYNDLVDVIFDALRGTIMGDNL